MPPAHNLTPHGLASELLDLIMTFVPSHDIGACTQVNSAWYLAAKPHLYRDVHLDAYFHVRGPEHPLIDVDVHCSTRPLFRRAWLTRVTHTLDVEAHHESFCACAVALPGSLSGHRSPAPLPASPDVIFSLLPPMPHLDTLRIPFDVHGALSALGFDPVSIPEPPAPCGLHTLPIRHLVHRGVHLDGANPTSSTFARASLKSYTGHLHDRELDCDPMHGPADGTSPAPSDSLAHGAVVVLVCPPPPPPQLSHSLASTFIHPAPPLSLVSQPFVMQMYARACSDPNCIRNLVIKLSAAIYLCAANGGRQVGLVGFEDLGADATPWVHAHVAFLTRSLVDVCVKWERTRGVTRKIKREKWSKPASPDIFRMVTRQKWSRFQEAQRAMPVLQRVRR